jgi:hypothetical protein
VPFLFRYRLIDINGNDLGPFLSSEPDWRPGNTIPRGGGDVLRVTAVVAPEPGHDFRAYLVVEPDGRTLESNAARL